MKLLDRMRQQKLLSTMLMVFTLSIGIVIGTLVNTGVNAAKAQNIAPDATPLVVPQAVETGNEFSKLAKKISPSVVNITADYTPKMQVTQHRKGGRQQQDDQEGDANDPSTDLFRRFFGGQGAPGQIMPQDSGKREQSGTGFIVDKNGYIVTNKHVVSNEEGNPVDHIKVKLHGEDNEYRARLIGFYRETDVAVLKIDAHHPLVPVTLSNSESVQVGDWAVAIGSPFGLQETVTAGIVSAMNRANIGEGQFQRFIQTDAAINPGNSGGPLLNIRGEVIGINTMIATRSGGYEGIGFALPVNMVVRVYNDIIRDGHVTRGSIGITWQNQNTKEALRAMGFDHGVIIEDVHKDGPAEKAGIKGEDVVLAINDKPLKDGDDLMSRVADMPVGTSCLLTVDRDGKRMDFKLVVMDRLKVFWDDPRVVGEVKNIPTANAEEEKPEVSKLVQFGIQLRALTEDEKALTSDKHGLYVARVEANSFAADIGMQERDIITSVDRHQVNSIEDVKKIQATLKPGDPVVFRVIRSTGATARGVHAGTPGTQVLLLPGTLPE
jgi:serine protease Do